MRRTALALAWFVLTSAVLDAAWLPLSPGAKAQPAQSEADQPAADTADRDPGRAEEEARAQEKARARALRMGTTYFGPAGGFYVVDAGSGADRSFRLQALTDFFVKKDYLFDGDKNRYFGSTFALSVTPIEHLELNAALTSRSNYNSRGEPQVLQSLGDLHFDLKGYLEPMAGLTLGGDVLLSFLGAPGDAGFDFGATSVMLRANLSTDLRELASREVPLILRANIGYAFDNSSELVEDLEDARFENLVESGRSAAESQAQEYRHLARRDERLAFGINRVDHVLLALGLEVPVEVSERFAIHPIAEWRLNVPSNRQGFDCPYVTTSDGDKLPGTDSCLADENVSTWNQNVIAGARFYPWVEGLSVSLGVNIGVGGSTNFVQELAPNAAYRVLLGLAYTADLKPKPPVIREVEKVVEVAPAQGQIQGAVVEQGNPAVVVAGARITFPDRDLTPLLSEADGTFTTYALPPGQVQLMLEAENYEPGTCAAEIPAEGGDVSVTCALKALPLVGSLVGRVADAEGAPLSGVSVMLTGPKTYTLVTDASGRFEQENLKPGDYQARVERAGYLVSITPVSIKLRERTEVTITLFPTPKRASVRQAGDQLRLSGTIFFPVGGTEIEPRSHALLTEIADFLIKHPEILRVEIQGHTDDTGDPDHSRELSQERAEAVKAWLVRAGVTADRLTAKGYGAEKPLVPNLTEANRAKNRRVELVITQRAGE